MKSTETTNSGKSHPVGNFKSSADIESFYRFVYENDLREESKKAFELILTRVVKEKASSSKRKGKKS